MEFLCMPLEDMGIEGVQQLLYVERYAWLSLTHDMAAVISLDGMFEDCNTHWEEHVGYSAQSLQGGYLVEHIHFDDRERALGEFQKLVTSDIGSANLSFRFLCADGDYRKLGLNVIFSPAHEAFFCIGRNRITSYNVCYTKLLRERDESFEHAAPPWRLPPAG